MPRSVPSGTPERPTQYPPVRRSRRLLAGSLTGGLGIVAAVLAFYAAGFTTAASPAPLVLSHGRIEKACEECHRSSFPHTVSDLRCERCHDPRATGRLAIAAHGAWIPPSRRAAADAPEPECASCHVDHRGPLAQLRGVGTASCARCHQFTTLARHPQFAIVGAKRSPALGLQFSHARHIDETRRALGRGCEACHRLSADLSTFEPTSFDRHCAVCHMSDGALPVMTDPVDEALVSPPAAAPDAIRRPGRGRLVVARLAHRDPWVLQNIRMLARGVYGDADVRERDALTARLASLDAMRTGSLAAAATPDLERRRDALRSGTARVVPHLLDRINLELERRAGGTAAPVSLAATLSDERALELAMSGARARLAALRERTSVPALAAGARARRMDEILSLASPCLTCHTLQNGIEIAPVRVDGRRLERARFTHAPHVIQAGCETCHDAITASASVTDLNTPGIETCRTCHASGRAPFGCTVCHRYHPSSDTAFSASAMK